MMWPYDELPPTTASLAAILDSPNPGADVLRRVASHMALWSTTILYAEERDADRQRFCCGDHQQLLFTMRYVAAMLADMERPLEEANIYSLRSARDNLIGQLHQALLEYDVFLRRYM